MEIRILNPLIIEITFKGSRMLKAGLMWPTVVNIQKHTQGQWPTSAPVLRSDIADVFHVQARLLGENMEAKVRTSHDSSCGLYIFNLWMFSLRKSTELDVGVDSTKVHNRRDP